MASSLGNIGSFFSGGTPSAGKGIVDLLGLGSTGLGLIGNISADQERAAAAKQAQANMNLSPAQLSSEVTQATQPLNAALVQAITGQTNANLAEQGLSQAPGLIATATSQALAPYEQQNQQAALQLVMQKLGLPAEFLKTIPNNAQLAPLLAMLSKGFGNNPASTNPFGFQTTGPTLPPQITDANTPGGGTTGTYDFGSLFAPGSTS
jgi:hypothetical protein